MADQRSSTRRLLAGFLVILFLMTSGAAFSLWSARRAANRIDHLVTVSLERERLIGLMRLDAAMLTQAADDHINATSDEERTEADRAMAVNVAEIKDTSERYASDLPKEEAVLWHRLSAVSERLVKKLEVTIKASNRKEAERARKHLEEEVKPINFELDDVADKLARTNAEETRALLHELQDVRLKTSALGAGVVGLALVLSLVVALQVTRTLRRQEHTIVAQLNELDSRNRELDAFASRVAHDLVAPLSPLKGYLTLARRQIEDKEVKELLAHAEASTSRMSELVDGLLRFCRAGKTMDKVPGELDTAVTTILLEQGQAAAAANVKLERHLTPGLTVQCPPQLLQSIAQNVLSNAVKYTAGRPEAKVSVSVRRDKNDAVFEVEDNGPGMTEADAKQLFQPFFRSPETRNIPGTGLGLATTKRLVDAFGGSIHVASTLDKGTTVTVRFPLDGREGPPRPSAPVPASPTPTG